ncbi:hypothetical protein KOW79_006021 [Hemibagrus wyckioides]|uniref:Uncharacterized protein n=1 Tax=Hemibagrus wyckioides TaxID=337641 RepID=A0A9D3NWD0_9TELE|nr:hypothetical protein KOW79_006021 [Hemibagrus wyckioides]
MVDVPRILQMSWDPEEQEEEEKEVRLTDLLRSGPKPEALNPEACRESSSPSPSVTEQTCEADFPRRVWSWTNVPFIQERPPVPGDLATGSVSRSSKDTVHLEKSTNLFIRAGHRLQSFS